MQRPPQQPVIGYLTPSGFYVPLYDLKRKLGVNYEKFTTKLTIVHKPKTGPVIRTRMYTIIKAAGHNDLRMYLPRTVMKVLLQARVINKVISTIPNLTYIDVTLQIDLFDDQVTIVNYLMAEIFTPERITAGTATCLLNLKAGCGKTFVAGGIIARLRVKTLFITPKCPLAEQAVRDLRMCFWNENTPIVIGQYHSTPLKRDPTTDYRNQHITVIVINTALTLSEEILKQYSLVIMDEAHMNVSEKRRAIFSKCTSACVLALSATTEDRNDSLDPIAHKAVAFDGIIRAENIPGFAYQNDTNFDLHAKIIHYIGPPEYTKNLTHESTGNIFTHYMHNQCIMDSARLDLAVDELIELYDWRGPDQQTHCIYVFAEELKILATAKDEFERILRATGRTDISIAAPELDVGGASFDALKAERLTAMFVGGLKREALADITRNSRVFFSTYGFAGQGISILKMTAMLLLTSRKSNFKQVFARIMRRGSDDSIPRIVVDINDKRTALTHQLKSRRVIYDFYGFKITETKIAYGDVKPPGVKRLVDAYWEKMFLLHEIIPRDIVWYLSRFIVRV